MEYSNLKLVLLLLTFAYAIWASTNAYKETGDRSMLWYPSWVDKNSGVSKPIRVHGIIAFTLLWVMLALYLYG